MIEAGRLDRLLGWHLLIPPRIGRRVHLLGFPQGSAELWSALRQEELVGRAEEADFRLYWEPDWRLIEPGPEGCAVVGGRGESSATPARRYALLPSADPRLVLPLWHEAQLQRGLRLHRPGRGLARLATRLAAALAALGQQRPLNRRMLTIVGGDLPDFGAEAVLYLGTPDPDRKTTILPAGAGRILKRGTSPTARAAIRNEAAALDRLSRTPLAAWVPKLLGLSEGAGHTVLEQECRRRSCASPWRQETAIIDFLSALSRVDEGERPVDALVGQHPRAELPPIVAEALARRRAIRGHRCHGDFAPWNLFWTRQGLFVFDWEASAPWAVACADAFTFAVAPAVHVCRDPDPGRVAAQAQALARKVTRTAGRDPADVPLCWAIWLWERHARDPHPLTQKMLTNIGASG